jgi:hypothetical protein
MSQVSYFGLAGVGGSARTDVRSQLNPYHSYLRIAINSTKQRKPVVAWREATDAEVVVFRERQVNRKRGSAKTSKRRDRQVSKLSLVGHWIILETAPWRPEESDKTFEAFFEADSIHDDERCWKGSVITVNNYDREGRALLVDRLPTSIDADDETTDDKVLASSDHMFGALIWLRPNTYQLERQQEALNALQNAPGNRHSPLIRLCASRPEWPKFNPVEEPEWIFLTDPSRSGTGEQRQFVQKAIATPDFAILEGPPGSGKTTAICELIGQLTRQGKRVLLVASTHVAVDNVLERMVAWQDQSEEKFVTPVRIASRSENVTSKDVEPWLFDRLKRTWRDDLLDFLEKPQKGTGGGAARKMLSDTLKQGDSALVRLILDTSNLVCGTTIGILQHPLIKEKRNGANLEPFDVMILDEASKTTFAEFVVPAIHAHKWVVVGDRRQLSPYVEEIDLADNLRNLLGPEKAQAAVHTALPTLQKNNPAARSVLAVNNDDEAELIRQEAEESGIFLCDLDRCEPRDCYGIPDAIPELLFAQLVIGRPETLSRFEQRLPIDNLGYGESLPHMPAWTASKDAYCSRAKQEIPEAPLGWADEVAWRLVRSYELRQNHGEKEKYQKQLSQLFPKQVDIGTKVDNIRRVAMPSILELLQQGFERLPHWNEDVALTAGIPDRALNDRMVSLSYQHRMHPEISAFPRRQFYTEKPILTDQEQSLLQMYGPEYRADQDFNLGREVLESLEVARGKQSPVALLQDAEYMKERREGGYPSLHRARWVAVNSRKNERGNISTVEADRIEKELKRFLDWAGKHRRPDGGPWEIAVLTFYLHQEKELRRRLQRLSKSQGNTRNFHFPAGSNKETASVHVTLCTVDRFQGHEADVVYLSFVKSRSVGFLNSPNRLNVALTRARYELVIFGDKEYFKGCNSDLLKNLANAPEYSGEIAWEKIK